MWRINSDGIARLLRTAYTHRPGRSRAVVMYEGAILGKRIAAGVCMLVLCAACLTAAGAQPGMNRVTDANNRFSIAFPVRWTVESIQHNTKILSTEVPVSQLPQGGTSQSAVVGVGPNTDFTIPPRLVVIPLDLLRPVSPDEFSNSVHENSAPSRNFQVTQDGITTIAGQRAYFLYGVSSAQGNTPSLYQVLIYIGRARAGFLIIGYTLNDPDRIRRDFATISQIMETFRIIP